MFNLLLTKCKKFSFIFIDGNGGVIVINNSNNNNNDKIRKILSGEGVNVSNFNEGFALPFEQLTKEEIGKRSITQIYIYEIEIYLFSF
jgi:hypothetical protein